MLRYNIIISLFFFSCNGLSQRNGTPEMYVSRVYQDSAKYSRDKLYLLTAFYRMMNNHEQSFSNKEYFDSTELIIDTVMYDPSLRKIAVFVIAKNPTFRNPYSDRKFSYYFNANCYLGKRHVNQPDSFELMKLGPFSEVNFYDLKEVKEALREDYFVELGTLLDENGNKVFAFNIDDKRFWEDEKGWQRLFR